jgi:CheY-like chemotaxis protein
MSLARTQPCVLFVEDNESLRIMFLVLLKKFGIDVDFAESYAEARAYLEKNAITGLITDDELGDGRGTELAEFALSQNPFAKVALVSGGRPDLPESLQGRVTVLEKPFSPAELREFLQDFPRAERPA